MIVVRSRGGTGARGSNGRGWRHGQAIGQGEKSLRIGGRMLLQFPTGRANYGCHDARVVVFRGVVAGRISIRLWK
jgi:hypothetical protein